MSKYFSYHSGLVRCPGVQSTGAIANMDPIDIGVTVRFYESGQLISLTPDCEYNFGPHGNYCRRGAVRREEKVRCVVALDILLRERR